MRDQYIIRYKTGVRPIIVSWGLAAIAVPVTIAVWLLGESDLAPISLIALVFVVFVAFYFLRRYRDIQLYADRMQVVSLFDGVLTEIRFRDIKHIGFLRGQSSYASSRQFGAATAGEDISELIILMHDGGRQQFIDEDFDYLPEVCAFIKERIGMTEQVF